MGILSFLFKKKTVNQNTNYSCPYCGGELPPPTRKRPCPHCQKIIYCRTRPDQPKQWVREEDLAAISQEWAKVMLREHPEFPISEDPSVKNLKNYFLNANRHAIRQWVFSGVVKTLKLYTANDELVCPACKAMHGKIFPITTPEEITFAMNNASVKECKNPKGCRCSFKPEKISD